MVVYGAEGRKDGAFLAWVPLELPLGVPGKPWCSGLGYGLFVAETWELLPGLGFLCLARRIQLESLP